MSNNAVALQLKSATVLIVRLLKIHTWINFTEKKGENSKTSTPDISHSENISYRQNTFISSQNMIDVVLPETCITNIEPQITCSK